MRLRTAGAMVLLAGTVCASCTVAVHGRGARPHLQGVPPGHMPPAGLCRVWYADRPAGHQPPPVNCSEARAAAARSRNARVIYGAAQDRANRR